MNKKVLIVVNDFTTVYNFRIELVEYLLKMGEEVYIALPNDERNCLLEEKGAKVIDLKMNRFGTNPIEDFKTTLAIRKIIKEINDIDLVVVIADEIIESFFKEIRNKKQIS